MGQQIPISSSFNLPDGRQVTLETGKLASLADGSVVVRIGDTMLFATVVSSKEAKAGQDFFPLSVDYQEKFASAGRIPGNFFRRETKISDYEVLISRLVDRAIRPLFPDGYMNETQVIIHQISGDKENLPDAYAALAASAALAVSDINFPDLISEVRVARINGVFHVNPLRDALKEADMDFIVAATMDNVMMVEGEAKECSEKDLIDAIKLAHEAIKVQILAQQELANKVGEKALNKRTLAEIPQNEEVKNLVALKCKDKIADIARAASDKATRKAALDSVKKELKENLLAEMGEEWFAQNQSFISSYYDKVKKETIRGIVLNEKVRLDGRGLKDIRSIWCEVDYLPSTHGSAIFTRGETQSLTSLTLGTKSDEMMVDIAYALGYEKFILHYNFPGYSVGEVKPNRGPGRREVGHANLAQRSLRQVMPDVFPYTLRIVSDILESNGSSSMATVCAGTLALMDAGVQIKAPVSGIAMGLITDGSNYAILSDILGDEDALGDMDFKVTGTDKGITACQMDIKVDGLPYQVMENALIQAKEGRIHILGEMLKTIAAPREDYKPHAPRIVELTIEKGFIGAVIGPGGKIIQEIQEQTGTHISITEVGDKGIVAVSSSDKAGIELALDRIRRITFMPAEGDIFVGVVKTVMPYGAFVDFHGKSGLLHVSEISHSRIENVEDVLKEGDEIKIQIVEIDKKTGKMRLSRKSIMPRPNKSQEGDAK